MSPNGRRAWRKWMRRVEHDPNLRPQGKSISLLAREGKRHLGSIPPTPAKPFTARSLVGMSQSARKRAARVACVGHRFKTRRLKLVWFKGWARDFRGRIAIESDKATITRYQEARAKYRIGERLRPCPGCEECRGYDDGIGVIHCDGSGVLPARKS